MKIYFNINLSKLGNLLNDNGYSLYRPRVGNYSSVLVKTEGKIVEIIEPISLFSLIEQCFNDEPDTETFNLLKISLAEEKAEWYELTTKGLQWLINDFLTDTKEESYFFFENTVVKVSVGEISMVPYSSLKRLLWQSQIVKHNFTLENLEPVKQSKFYKFIQGGSSFSVQCTENEFLWHLTSFIGCLLHNGEESSDNSLLILTDSTTCFNDNVYRKSILLRAIGKLTSTIYLDGSHGFYINELKEKLSPETNLVVIENVVWIDLLELNEFLKINPSIKICVISKYPLLKETKTQYCFISGYSSEPLIENQYEYFNDWNYGEWNLFYSLLIYSAQYYLYRGIVISQSTNCPQLEELLMLTNPKFFNFMNNNIKTGVDYPWEHYRDGYISSYPHFYPEIEMSDFKLWVQAYADYKNYELICKTNIAEDFFILKELSPVKLHIE